MDSTTRNIHAYRARGITVCDRWESFENFLADMGQRPSRSHSIDRINNDGNYEPSNCRWATKKEQSDNRRLTIRVTIGGVEKVLVDWARESNISPSTMHRRFRAGITGADLLAPPMPRHMRSQCHKVPR